MDIKFVLVFALVLCAVPCESASWVWKSFSEHTPWVVKPSGENTPNNAWLTGASSWPSVFNTSDPKPAEDYLDAQYRVPSILSQNDTTIICTLNHGSPRMTDMANEDAMWNLIQDGTNNVSENFTEFFCGEVVTANTWMELSFNETSAITDTLTQGTIDAVQARMRIFAIVDDAHQPQWSLSNSGEDLTFTFTIPHPPQGARLGYDAFAVVGYASKSASLWTPSTGPDFCTNFTEIDTADSNYGTDWTISMDIDFTTFAGWGMVVNTYVDGNGNTIEERTFQARLELLDCSPTTDFVDTISAVWYTSGIVTFNLSVSASIGVGSSPIHSEVATSTTTVQMDAFLKWCDQDSTCANATVGQPTYTLGQEVFVLLEIPDTSRIYETRGGFLWDNADNRLASGEMEFEFVSQEVGRIIFTFKPLAVFGDASLTVEAKAESLSRRLAADGMLGAMGKRLLEFVDDTSEEQYARATAALIVEEAESEETETDETETEEDSNTSNEDEEDDSNNDGDSAGNLFVTLSAFYAMFVLYF